MRPRFDAKTCRRALFAKFEHNLNRFVANPPAVNCGRQSVANRLLRRVTMCDVFLCHLGDDKPWSRVLYQNLRSQGWSVFFDEASLIPGRSHVQAIDEAIRTCRKAIVVCSERSMESGWVREEVAMFVHRRAKDVGFAVIPVVISADTPKLPFMDHVQCVDFRDRTEPTYRRAFAKLLAGLRGESPGPEPRFDGPLEIPPLPVPITVSDGKSLTDAVFQAVFRCRGAVVVAQAGRMGEREKSRLRDEARRHFGEQHVLRVAPPLGTRTDDPERRRAEFFTVMGRQCGFASPTESALQLQVAVQRTNGRRCLLLVSGFEHGTPELQREFGSCLRSLHETAPGFHVVVLGGQALNELFFTDGENSLFNFAERRFVADVEIEPVQEEWRRRHSLAADATLPADTVARLRTFTGDDPRLLDRCVEHLDRAGQFAESAVREQLLQDAELWRAFRLSTPTPELAARVRELLRQDSLAPLRPHYDDKLLDTLFWSNLLCHRGGRLVWRCDIVREIGRQVFEVAS